MAQLVEALDIKPDELLHPKNIWWKERTNSSKLSFGLHTHACTHTHMHTIFKTLGVFSSHAQ